MKILIINAGSSSIKYQLLEMPSEQVLCQGIIERIGAKDAIFKYKTDVTDLDEVLDIPSHKVGLTKIAEHLLDSKIGVIQNADEIFFVNAGELIRAGSFDHAVDMLLHGDSVS